MQDVTVRFSDGVGHTAFAGGGGAGASHSNVAAYGGQYGIRWDDSEPAPLLLGATLVGQTVSAIEYAGQQTGSFVGVNISAPPGGSSGAAISSKPGHPISVIDAIIDCSSDQNANMSAVSAGSSVYLKDVWTLGCRTLLSHPPASRHKPVLFTGQAGARSRAHIVELARGANFSNRGATAIMDLMYVDGQRFPARTISNISSALAQTPPNVVASRLPWVEARAPSWWSSAVPKADAVRDCGAKGDGVTDDTVALQACLDAHNVVLLPKGLFRISNTLQMRANTALAGLSQTHSVIAPMSGGFARGSNSSSTSSSDAQPLLRTAVQGRATIAFLGLTTWWHLPGIFTLDWRARKNTGTQKHSGGLRLAIDQYGSPTATSLLAVVELIPRVCFQAAGCGAPTTRRACASAHGSTTTPA